MLVSNPAQTRSGELALRFLRAAQDAGWTLDTAFFYHSAAHAVLNGSTAAGGWLELARSSGLRCVLCGSALARAGADPGGEYPAPFVAGGLADWLAASERSQRLLRFGGAG